ncbi:excisionase family DNA-binding protein [uncultured Gemmiger sp.]|nr:excisionase family DNA-binding protein [uncultured Gemmiger sp.]
MAIEPNVFYTIEQAAERMQLSVETVKQMIREKRLRASVLGK